MPVGYHWCILYSFSVSSPDAELGFRRVHASGVVQRRAGEERREETVAVPERRAVAREDSRRQRSGRAAGPSRCGARVATGLASGAEAGTPGIAPSAEHGDAASNAAPPKGFASTNSRLCSSQVAASVDHGQ
jgi:hypothetical protein